MLQLDAAGRRKLAAFVQAPVPIVGNKPKPGELRIDDAVYIRKLKV